MAGLYEQEWSTFRNEDGEKFTLTLYGQRLRLTGTEIIGWLPVPLGWTPKFDEQGMAALGTFRLRQAEANWLYIAKYSAQAYNWARRRRRAALPVV